MRPSRYKVGAPEKDDVPGLKTPTQKKKIKIAKKYVIVHLFSVMMNRISSSIVVKIVVSEKSIKSFL